MGVATHPEVDAAIEDIVNESITSSEMKSSVEINLDNVEVQENIKKLELLLTINQLL